MKWPVQCHFQKASDDESQFWKTWTNNQNFLNLPRRRWMRRFWRRVNTLSTARWRQMMEAAFRGFTDSWHNNRRLSTSTWDWTKINKINKLTKTVDSSLQNRWPNTQKESCFARHFPVCTGDSTKYETFTICAKRRSQQMIRQFYDNSCRVQEENLLAHTRKKHWVFLKQYMKVCWNWSWIILIRLKMTI